MKRQHYLLALVALIVIGGCAWAVLHILPTAVREYESSLPGCMPNKPPAGFEAELVGTWQAGVPDNLDTLIIREDHTYKQSVHGVANKYYGAVDYEGDWRRWWIEYRANGIPYLHLEGMRFCGLDRTRSCAETNINGYDFCSDRFVPMKQEGILLVIKRQELMDPSSPWMLTLAFPEGYENTWMYTQSK